MIDSHCHILPGCDDGSPSMDYSISMLKQAKESGFDKIIFTSHIKDNFANINEQKLIYNKIKPIANSLEIKTAFGSEIHSNKLLEIDLNELSNMTLGKSNMILLEFPLSNVPPAWKTIINKIQNKGLDVIIAHPERYYDIIQDHSIAQQMKDSKCKFMLSATYINPWIMGHGSTSLAKKLIKKGLVDFIASDAHSLENYKFIKPAYAWATKHGFDMQKSQKILEMAFQ